MATLCVDCAVIVANGTDDEPDKIAHAAKMLDLGGILVLTGDEDDFATRPCDGCGDHLAGQRFEAAIL